MPEQDVAYQLRDLEKSFTYIQKELAEQKTESEKLRDRIQTLETTRAILIGIAAIFGITGAWGASALQSAQGKLATVQSQVTDLQQKGTQPILDAERKAVADATEDIRNIRDGEISTFNRETAATLQQAKAQIQTSADHATAAVQQAGPGMQSQIDRLQTLTNVVYDRAYEFSECQTFGCNGVTDTSAEQRQQALWKWMTFLASEYHKTHVLNN